MRNIEGIQLVGTEHGLAIFIGYNKDFIIVDTKTDSIYINPTVSVFRLLAKDYGDEYEFAKSCFSGLLTQAPFSIRDFDTYRTKLRILQQPPIDWDKVNEYIERSMQYLLKNQSLDKFIIDIYTALRHACEDYPEELINTYRVRMKGVQYV